MRLCVPPSPGRAPPPPPLPLFAYTLQRRGKSWRANGRETDGARAAAPRACGPMRAPTHAPPSATPPLLSGTVVFVCPSVGKGLGYNASNYLSSGDHWGAWGWKVLLGGVWNLTII